MNKLVKYILLSAMFAFILGIFSGVSGRTNSSMGMGQNTPKTSADTTPKVTTRYPVKKTQVTTFDDLSEKNPVDLRTPSNVTTEVEYDIKNNVYLFKTKIGDQELTTPFSMTQKEYNDYTLKQSMADYFRVKNNELIEQGTTKDVFNLKDISIPIGPAEKIFGPGGVKIRPQGYVEFSAGVKRSKTDDPTLSERKRTTTIFDVDQKINLSVSASVGDKMNFDLNYNTEAAFDFDSKKMKLAYEGKEDEIVKYLEAGNVSLNTTNSLIGGANSLFGIRADLQFGKLRVNTVVSQQESESKSVGSKGGVQSQSFDFMAVNYEENAHFFIGHYFRNDYDRAMQRIPYVDSPVSITKMEVWVTNTRRSSEQNRDVVAFVDLGEHNEIKNTSLWSAKGTQPYPSNESNNLYETIINNYAEARNINQVTTELEKIGMVNGQDFERLQNARMLSSSEYTFNPKLGYISLTGFTLQPAEVLGVYYEYEINGKVYRVGEPSASIPSQYVAGQNNSGALFLKLLKPVSLSPDSYAWDLMMKNIYRLGAYNVQSDRFRLNITYQNDSVGTYVDRLSVGKIKNIRLLNVMNLDRLDSRLNPVIGEDGVAKGDGIFDFIEGLTITASNGRIMFPVIEPFGEHLKTKIADPDGDKYVFSEIYTHSKTEAEQVAEKNKFKISGSYRASNSNEIDLGVTNVVKGSVRVTAGGNVLTENVDYTVDYMGGKVIIINQSLIDSKASINASVENQSFFNMQKKTLLGTNVTYDFSKNFSIGTTLMHMYEKPLTTKATIGSEAVKNTLIGFNTSYRTESQWLTNLMDKIPFVEATVPSQIAFNGEFAKMIPGHFKNKYAGGYSYLDDFESSRSRISMRDPYAWSLSSTPSKEFPEDAASNEMEYNQNRALLSWYYIDRMFTRENSTNVPQHIKNDKEQLSSHFVREVRVDEIYPNRETMYNETAVQTVLNLSYYPEQRGPYNLNLNVDAKGKLKAPHEKWGGMTRAVNQTDFEATNVEYIEFWLMDPFVYNGKSTAYQEQDNDGGTLYFNLGEVSEEVLKDGYKFYENGLPTDNDTTQYTTTYWGRVPTRSATVYAFDNSLSNDMLRAQDVGFNGLSTKQELEFDLYKNYVDAFREIIKGDAAVLAEFENDPFSPLKDPAGDNYHYFRGSDYDRKEVSILDRYKYINNSEGNTFSSNESYSTSYKKTPDVEDINQDFTMNETESYYQYKVELRPDKMTPETNRFLTDTREVSVQLANGKTEQIKWYQFKVPLKEYADKQGNIRSFKTIRFMRMLMTDFKQTTHLRFATLDLVRGEWRAYTQALEDDGAGNGELVITSVNIEENSTRTPVSYVVPPGVSRILDPGQPQLRQENEQALSLKVIDLEKDKARAVHKNANYDLRRYKRIQMFVHAESVEKKSPVGKGELAVFMRLGSDYKNNYYEYEIPLSITPEGTYNTNNYNDQLAVWPKDNMFDFQLELLKDAKLSRNKKMRQPGSNVSFTKPYSYRDPENPSNGITVVGNPSLAEVNVIMIGIRNISSSGDKSVEVWVNELRLGDFDEEGGWAAQGSLNIAFSDIGTLQLTGRKETAGFGSIEQSLMERRQDDFTSYSISTNVDLGRFVPEKVKASIPLYYTYSNETVSPKYDPLDKDVTLKESLSLVSSKAEKDSIKSLAQDKVVSKSFSISGAKINIRSKTPMPYDPANFSFGYAHSMTETKDPNTVYDQVKNYSAKFNYNYSPMAKTWEPFKNIKSKAPMAKYAKSLGFNFFPSNIAINSDINRYYTETLIRDLENYVVGQNTRDNEFLSFSSNFYWDRDLSVQWDFTKNLRGTIQTGTKAEIEEPFLQVNKKLNPDDYDTWKEEVQRSLLRFGSPLTYRQTASLVYNLPFNNIPFLDWINSTANYNSTYNWDKGATIDGGGELGNTIRNSLTFSVNNRINMVNLYNKWDFLKKVNQKFAQASSSSRNIGARPAARPAPRKKKFEKLITLSNDSAVTLVHNLNTKNIQLTAKREEDNRTYPIKFKKVGKNKVQITSRDSIVVRVNILEKDDPEESTWYKIAQYSARGLMSIRSFSVNYSIRNENSIYGFKPNIGDFFGQSSSMIPGLGFAFGFDGDEKFVDKSIDKNWLVAGTDNINPAIFSKMEKLDISAVLEPVRGLKIDLKAFRENAESNSLRISDDGSGAYNRSYLYGGNFSMSVLTISSAFESLNADKGYESKTFQKFLSNRETLRNRLQQKYDNRFPNVGGMVDAVGENSADVLVPAFISAYMNKDVNSVSFSPILAFSSMFPGWNITYDGLTTLPWFKDKFKSFKLTHSYNSQYRVGSYSSFAGWMDLGEDLGFVESILGGGRLTPTSRFDVGSVNLVEDFNPLFGIEGTLKNSMTLKARYIKGRALGLNIASFQIVETLKNEIVIGMGYRINEFNRIVGLTPKRGVNNDLNITGDISFRRNQTLLRRIEGEYTQATSGSSVTTLKMSADYTMTRALTLRAYFDKVINRPLMSASSPTSVTNFGVSIRFNLTQ